MNACMLGNLEFAWFAFTTRECCSSKFLFPFTTPDPSLTGHAPFIVTINNIQYKVIIAAINLSLSYKAVTV